MKIQIILITVYLVSSTYGLTRCTGVQKPECTTLFPNCFYNITCNGETWNELHTRTPGHSGVCRDSRGYAYDESETWIFLENGKSLPDCMEKAYRYNAFAAMFTRARWYSHPTLGNDYYFTCKLLFQSGDPLPHDTIGTTNRRRGGVGNIAFVTSHNLWFCWAPPRSILTVSPPTTSNAPLETSQPSLENSEILNEKGNSTSFFENHKGVIIGSSIGGGMILTFISVAVYNKIKKHNLRQVTV